ncbi:MAG: hypothetical protein IH946_08200 [Bacteroidetes bacterium]|nr:hypothetical protein [Bacteroidota bacterium]
MKKVGYSLLWFGFVIFSGFAACRGEEVGTATYFLDNQSSYNLISRNWGNEVIVNSKEKVEIGGAASFGGNPGIGGDLILYRDSLGTEIVAYEQIPIDETLWLVEEQGNTTYGSFYLTMVVTDDMIR